LKEFLPTSKWLLFFFSGSGSFFIISLLCWGYIVTFSKVLTIHHS
jgi:hypothetical protein